MLLSMVLAFSVIQQYISQPAFKSHNFLLDETFQVQFDDGDGVAQGIEADNEYYYTYYDNNTDNDENSNSTNLYYAAKGDDGFDYGNEDDYVEEINTANNNTSEDVLDTIFEQERSFNDDTSMRTMEEYRKIRGENFSSWFEGQETDTLLPNADADGPILDFAIVGKHYDHV